MRILHISSARALGGGEKHLSDLVGALAARGHEVHAAIARDGPLLEELKGLPARNIKLLPLRNALDVPSAIELTRMVRRLGIEIVHAHMARDYPLAAYATRRATRARLIITRHVLFPMRRFHAMTLAHAARVIAVSRGVARSLTAQRIFPAHKICVIPNGIDLERFDERAQAAGSDGAIFLLELGLAPERLLIGTAGEINLLKGHEEFVRAANRLAARFPHVEFLIAGDDFSRTGEHLARLKRLIAELNLQGRVHLLGWLPDVAPFLSALDLFVSASRTESFGLSIVEALASGLPVVATATEGALEIIEDGVSGLLVNVGDEEALANSLARLIGDAEERARMSARARELARERFGLERMVAATEEVYREALLSS